jgi:hypothetical protein
MTAKWYYITYLDSNNNTLQDSYYTDSLDKAEQTFRIRNKDIKQILSIL